MYTIQRWKGYKCAIQRGCPSIIEKDTDINPRMLSYTRIRKQFSLKRTRNIQQVGNFESSKGTGCRFLAKVLYNVRKRTS